MTPVTNLNTQKDEDTIDFGRLYQTFFDNKIFIFIFAIFTSILLTFYVFSLPNSPYFVKSTFLKPSANSIVLLNESGFIEVSREKVFDSFLTKIKNSKLQKQVFLEGNYLSKLPESDLVVDKNAFINSFTKSITVLTGKDNKGTFSTVSKRNEQPSSLMIKGQNPEILSEYSKDLMMRANVETISEFTDLINKKLNLQLNQLNTRSILLLEAKKLARLSEIALIEEEDAIKAGEIKKLIKQEIYRLEQLRLNEIKFLTQQSLIANAMGVIEHNLGLSTSSKEQANISGTYAPDWFLYGKKAIDIKINLLKDNSNATPYSTTLISLKNKLQSIQNNTYLQTLKNRKNDQPFIEEEGAINFEIRKITKFMINRDSRVVSESNALLMSQGPVATTYPLNKKLVIILSFFLSIIIGFIIVLIRSALKTSLKEKNRE